MVHFGAGHKRQPGADVSKLRTVRPGLTTDGPGARADTWTQKNRTNVATVPGRNASHCIRRFSGAGVRACRTSTGAATSGGRSQERLPLSGVAKAVFTVSLPESVYVGSEEQAQSRSRRTRRHRCCRDSVARANSCRSIPFGKNAGTPSTEALTRPPRPGKLYSYYTPTC